MSLIKEIPELRNEIKRRNKNRDLTIGLVPTMGYLHQGHLSLIERARKENDLVVVSIFVNPNQFSPDEDLDSYPRDIERDYKSAIKAGADLVFNPEVNEMYGRDNSSFVQVEGDITKKLCGRSRPSHFKGVTTVVAKLFNIVKPRRAYFGQKDAQQIAVVEKMVRDLDFDVDIVSCDLVREEDGLAMSSRNVYLSEEERSQALVLSESLFKARDMFLKGERDPNVLRGFIVDSIEKKDLAEIDYVEVLDAKDLSKIDRLDRKTLIALAVKFGSTRLLDNIYLEV